MRRRRNESLDFFNLREETGSKDVECLVSLYCLLISETLERQSRRSISWKTLTIRTTVKITLEILLVRALSKEFTPRKKRVNKIESLNLKLNKNVKSFKIISVFWLNKNFLGSTQILNKIFYNCVKSIILQKSYFFYALVQDHKSKNKVKISNKF